MRSEKSLVRLDHILENIERVEHYVADCDFQRFTQDGLRRDAIERCLARISEAARKLGTRRSNSYPANRGLIFAAWAIICGMTMNE